LVSLFYNYIFLHANNENLFHQHFINVLLSLPTLQADDDLYTIPLSLAPEFTKTPRDTLVKPAGNVAELKCPARGENLVTSWQKVGLCYYLSL